MNINIDLLQSKYHIDIPADIAESLSRKYGLVSEIKKSRNPDNLVKTRPAGKKPDIHSSIERKKSTEAVEVNEKYIQKMQQAFKSVAGLIPDYDRKVMEKLMSSIIEADDYYDAEDIMGKINSKVQQHIYDTSKLALDDIPKIEQFIISIGYRPVPVKTGDSIKDNIMYFTAIEVKNSQPDLSKKIKAIDNKPYKIKYIDGSETAELILRGSCTYYK